MGEKLRLESPVVAEPAVYPWLLLVYDSRKKAWAVATVAGPPGRAAPPGPREGLLAAAGGSSPGAALTPGRPGGRAVPPPRPERSPRFRRAGTPGSVSLPSAVTEVPRSPRGGRPHWGCRLWRGPGG
ncbi:myosin IC heavy chain-like isoform X2 [Balaenoptera acutorostrata]|uniref:Myosin IC heavy chain-like isoform X2 n=1 Tax=Balaenoptera acutorostrata TaxID=9767 RepID=A0ABM3SQZ9_BALAC|nr:myosin IC heavy chain-like isoform X2 [Balaenoptera acutorostrata]